MPIRRPLALAACLATSASCQALLDFESGRVGAGATDASPSVEAGTADGGATADAARFCDGVDAAFCDDFDDGASIQFPPWEPVSASGGVKLTTAGALSLPHALEVTLPPSFDNTYTTGLKTSGLRGRRLQHSFALRAPNGIAGLHAFVASLTYFPPKAGAYVGINVFVQGGRVSLVLDGDSVSGAGVGGVAPDLSVWNRFTLDVDAERGQATLARDAKKIDELDFAGAVPVTDPTWEVRVGHGYPGNTTPPSHVLVYDDVFVVSVPR